MEESPYKGSRYESLLQYLNDVDGSFGCKARYDDKIAGRGPDRAAWLAGHYYSLLTTVIELIGKHRLLRLAEIMTEIEMKEKSL